MSESASVYERESDIDRERQRERKRERARQRGMDGGMQSKTIMNRHWRYNVFNRIV